MRVIGAALFFLIGMVATAALLERLVKEPHSRLGSITVGGVTVVAFIVLIVIASLLFNKKGTNLLGGKSIEQQAKELEEQGLLESTDYLATRAFGVDEFEDEGLSYFVELTDGRVLFLSGQYLYDYEPDPKENRARVFPCSDFSIRRHRSEGYVVDLQCRGNVIEPDVAAPFSDSDWTNARIPQDGEIIATATYDALKKEQLSR